MATLTGFIDFMKGFEKQLSDATAADCFVAYTKLEAYKEGATKHGDFMKTSSRETSAFTFVELLVVLATLALLAVTLLPVLAGTQSQSKSAACAANFRQWAVSANLYANDYQDQLPSFNCAGGGKYAWDVGTGMCTNLGLYGLTVPSWFCPFRPNEWDAANNYGLQHWGNPIQNNNELTAYFSANFPNELELKCNYWVQRNGDSPPDAAGVFPKDYSTVPFPVVPNWVKVSSSFVYGWPKKLHDSAVAHVPFVSDSAPSGQGLGLNSSLPMSTNVNNIAPNTAHFVNGILIGVNAAYADGHVENHSPSQMHAAYANGDAYWFY
jgi:prepilin-type processing-associated H-X9-DG protein